MFAVAFIQLLKFFCQCKQTFPEERIATISRIKEFTWFDNYRGKYFQSAKLKKNSTIKLLFSLFFSGVFFGEVGFFLILCSFKSRKVPCKQLISGARKQGAAPSGVFILMLWGQAAELSSSEKYVRAEHFCFSQPC